MTTNLLSQIADELSGVLDRPVAEKLAQVLVATYERMHESLVLQRLDALETVMRRSHEELARRLEEQLAAHRRETDERFRELREEQQRMYAEFAEFRKETDRRFRELREEQQRMYAEFTEFRKETDRRFRELREEQQRMYAEFQEYRKQTDERFRELADAQRRTEERLAELAQAMLQTRQEMQDIRRQLGGLSQTVGYVLENEAMKALPELLARDYGLRVEGRLKRGYVNDSAGRSIEVNIFGTAVRDGEQVTIVGESKSQLSKNDIDRFLRRTIEGLREVYPNILPVIVTHITSEPDAEEYARSLGVAVYYSYEF